MKKYLLIFVAFILSFSLIGCDFFGAAGTTTTQNQEITEPTEFLPISTAEQLAQIDVTKSYVLVNDINLGGAEWEPLGSAANPFSGWFDGNDFTISNYVITEKNDNYNGLFGVATGNIFDLTIANFSISYSTDFMTYAGGLVGHMTGNITNVDVNGTINVTNTSSNTYAGLLSGFHSAYITSTMTVSQFEPSEVINCSSEGTITVISKNFAYVGGITGKAYNIHLSHASSNVNMTVTSQKYRAFAGGLIGHNFSGILANYEDVVDSTDILIENCFANSTILIRDGGTWSTAGGLIGYNQYGVIKESFAQSSITLESDDHSYVGGLIGDDWNGKYESNVANVTVVVNADDNEVKSLGLSGLIGSINDQTLIEKSYYVINYSGAVDTTLGESTDIANLASVAWYQMTLLWDDLDFINLAIARLTQE